MGEIMIKRLYIIIGNGFSIDVIRRIGRQEDIDLVNLFRKGADVPWPGTNTNGFLSYKYCQSLWTLGARTTLSREESLKLIEDIITCVNVYNYSRMNNINKANIQKIEEARNNIFLRAYGELTTYLRYLIIYYNSKVSDTELASAKIPLISYISKCSSIYDQIVIINYNYDIWLERLLNIHHLPFDVGGFEDNNLKIKVIKPHGSISFSFKVKINSDFSIRHSEFDNITQDVSQFEIKYDFKDDFPLVNAIIPPAGDSIEQI